MWALGLISPNYVLEPMSPMETLPLISQKFLLQSVVDAQWLAYQLQMYYASESDRREEILKTFNRFPDKFDHMSVINELNAEIQSGTLGGSSDDSHKP